jgi:hypothetical protein
MLDTGDLKDIRRPHDPARCPPSIGGPLFIRTERAVFAPTKRATLADDPEKSSSEFGERLWSENARSSP